MKIRMIKLTPEYLVKALQGKADILISNLPGDTELLDIKCDLFCKQIYAIVRSNSFKDAPETQPPPELNLAYLATVKSTTQTEQMAKAGTSPQSGIKPEKGTIKTQLSSGYTGKIEEEFTPEQRKLLNFKVEGDDLIVKPAQFLSDEWEDINEIVKSLGGKWVKGDVISYWTVPLKIQS
ncbi:MAG: hypothetical protein N3D85_02935 [Candidatus Bathyarchaeota archaeon]|nr:hypothetical protein [Candidatus Bathyarchaeota archaeon]